MQATPEIKELIELIEKKKKIVALLAPSFVIDFSYPEIIGMLKRLGFSYVTEVSAGAVETNKKINLLLKKNPKKKYITNVCPGITRLIKVKYPQLTPFLTPVDSPMAVTAKIVEKKYPNHKKVYIGPCFAKKLEAKEDYPKLKIMVLTYKELEKVFKIKKIKPKKADKKYSFDIVGQKTRLYPISGGLTQSIKLNEKMTDPEYDVLSGPKPVEKAIQEFPKNPELKIIDVLHCEGGCISGAGIITKESTDKRRKKIIAHWENK